MLIEYTAPYGDVYDYTRRNAGYYFANYMYGSITIVNDARMRDQYIIYWRYKSGERLYQLQFLAFVPRVKEDRVLKRVAGFLMGGFFAEEPRATYRARRIENVVEQAKVEKQAEEQAEEQAQAEKSAVEDVVYGMSEVSLDAAGDAAEEVLFEDAEEDAEQDGGEADWVHI